MNEGQFSESIVELKESVARLEEKIGGALKRADEQQRLSATIYENSSSFKLLSERIQHIFNSQEDMRREIDEIKMRPGKRWDVVVERIIIALVTAAVGFLMARNFGN